MWGAQAQRCHLQRTDNHFVILLILLLLNERCECNSNASVQFPINQIVKKAHLQEQGTWRKVWAVQPPSSLTPQAGCNPHRPASLGADLWHTNVRRWLSLTTYLVCRYTLSALCYRKQHSPLNICRLSVFAPNCCCCRCGCCCGCCCSLSICHIFATALIANLLSSARLPSRMLRPCERH